jgi:hypothetical protein
MRVCAPTQVVPFPLFELQAKLVARILSGAVDAPSEDDMKRAAAEATARLAPRGGVLRRHAHAMTLEEQFDYDDRRAPCKRGPACLW